MKHMSENGTIPPEIQPTQPVFPPSSTSEKSGIGILLAFIIIPVVLLILLSTGMVLAAYEKIPIGNSKIQSALTDIVMSLPFTPKTPKYIMAKSADAQLQAQKFFFNLSFAATSNSLTPIFGSSNLDLALKGPVDYSDLKNPTISLDVESKDLNVDYILKDKFHYFKVNKFPAVLDLIIAEIGLGSASDIEKVFLNKWLYIDEKPLDTDARKQLDNATKDSGSITSGYVDKLFTTLKQKEYVNMLKMNKESFDGSSTYKIHFEPSNALLDKVYIDLYKSSHPSRASDIAQTKISDIISKLKMDTWIDDKTYYVRKILVSYEMKTDLPSPTTSANVDSPYMGAPLATPFSPFAGSSPIPMTISLILSDYGKNYPIDKPQNATSLENIFKQLSEQMASSSVVLQQRQLVDSQFQEADNTNRRSAVVQILNGIGAYQADKHIFPPGITSTTKEISKTGADLCQYLYPTYVAALPVDPAKGVAITNCTSNYDTGYTIRMDVSGKVTVSAPLATGTIVSVTR